MKRPLRVADEVWLATASLHREHPERSDFHASEILARAEQHMATGGSSLRPSARLHIYLHCVANRPPNPGRYRMLIETSSGHRRLFRPGDPCHPLRDGGKSLPKRQEVPTVYRELIDWCLSDYVSKSKELAKDPVLALKGLGKDIWVHENADEFVLRQREAWN